MTLSRARFALLVPIILAAGLRCGSATQTADESPIALHVGEKATVQGGELVVTFAGVAQDSRCPKGEQCITAGKALLNFEATPRGESPVAFQLDTSRDYESEVVRWRIGLVSLEPRPVSGRPITAGDYVAKISINRS